MVHRKMFWWEAAGFTAVAVLGTLLHFVYEWTGGNPVAAAFSAVNESTWEHMKLLFFPLFVFSVVQVCLQGPHCPNFLAVRAVSALAGTGAIPVLYYTYSGILGRSVDWVNIAIFYVAALVTFAVDGWLLRRGRLARPWMQVAGLALLWGMAFLFIWCTWHPVRLPLWQDPVTGGYGIG